jgi:hypothetical protein
MKGAVAGWPYGAAIVLLALGLSAVTFSYPGTPDVGDFLRWSGALQSQGPRAGYAAIADYPPLGPLLLWAATSAGRVFGLGDFSAIKLAIDLFQAASAIIAGIRFRSWVAAGLLWVLITPFGALLGYIDVFYLPFILLGVFALERDRFALAGLLFAAAGLIKWQPIVVAPVILVYAVSRAAGARKLFWMLPAALFVVAVVLGFGVAPCWRALGGATGDRLFSGQAFNLDWILTYALEAWRVDGLHFAGGTMKFITALPPPWYGLSRALFWLVYAANLAIFGLRRKTADTLLLALAAAEAINFTFNTGVHENHAFLEMIFVFAAVFAGALPPLYLMLAAALAISNILCFYGLDVVHGAAASAGTVILSMLQIGMCGLLIQAVATFREGR